MRILYSLVYIYCNNNATMSRDCFSSMIMETERYQHVICFMCILYSLVYIYIYCNNNVLFALIVAPCDIPGTRDTLGCREKLGEDTVRGAVRACDRPLWACAWFLYCQYCHQSFMLVRVLEVKVFLPYHMPEYTTTSTLLCCLRIIRGIILK